MSYIKKGKPLLYSIQWLARLVHSRGDGLSSPWQVVAADADAVDLVFLQSQSQDSYQPQNLCSRVHIIIHNYCLCGLPEQ